MNLKVTLSQVNNKDMPIRLKAVAITGIIISQIYHPFYIPTEDDASVKESLRMRDDLKLTFKKLK